MADEAGSVIRGEGEVGMETHSNRQYVRGVCLAMAAIPVAMFVGHATGFAVGLIGFLQHGDNLTSLEAEMLDKRTYVVFAWVMPISWGLCVLLGWKFRVHHRRSRLFWYAFGVVGVVVGSWWMRFIYEAGEWKFTTVDLPPVEMPLTQWILDPESGHYYRLIGPMLYIYADREAEEMGGYLVRIDSPDENEWIMKTFRPVSAVWIGLRRIDTDRISEWQWTSIPNQKAPYLNWRSGMPRTGTRMFCAIIRPISRQDAGKWDNAPPQVPCYAIVERDDPPPESD